MVLRTVPFPELLMTLAGKLMGSVEPNPAVGIVPVFAKDPPVDGAFEPLPLPLPVAVVLPLRTDAVETGAVAVADVTVAFDVVPVARLLVPVGTAPLDVVVAAAVLLAPGAAVVEGVTDTDGEVVMTAVLLCPVPEAVVVAAAALVEAGIVAELEGIIPARITAQSERTGTAT